MPEEDYTLRFSTVGQSDVEMLAAKLAQAEGKIKTLMDAMDRSPRVAQGYAKALQSLHMEVATTTMLMAKFGTVTDTTYGLLDRAKQRMSTASTESGRFQQSLQRLGYAADDLQYVFQNGMGLRPIINNLMQASPLLGAVALAADLLYRNWDNIESLWAGTKAKTEAQLMEELGNKTNKTAEETKRLYEWELKRDTMKAQSQGRTAVDKARNEGANRAIVEAGYEDMVQGLALVRYGADPRMMSAKTGNERAKIFDEIVKNSATEIQGALANSALGEQQLQSLIQTMIKNPEFFGGRDKAMKTAAGLMEASRPNQEAEKQNEAIVARAAQSKETRDKLKAIDDWKISKMVEGENAMKRGEDNFSQEQERLRQIEKDSRDKDVAFQVGRFNRLGGQGLLEDVITGRLRMGANAADLIKEVGGGLEPAFGKDKAREMARETVESAQGRLMAEQNNPRISTSQTMAAASIAEYLQGGVGNKDTVKQQLEVARAANTNLGRILQELIRTRRMGVVARAG